MLSRRQLELINRKSLKYPLQVAEKDYMLALTLQLITNSPLGKKLVFKGGTAIHHCYLEQNRFSEDLDFSSGQQPISLKEVQGVLTSLDNLEIKKQYQSKTTIKIERLLYTGPLNYPNSIKVEIDSNPPAGAKLETSIIRKHCLLNLQHYDKSSLLAGKLHALSSRKYTKGRDVYDLMWYLSDRTWPEPNILLLNNALKQTAWSGAELTEENWRQQIAMRVSEFDWNKVIADVKPFIEKQSDLQMLTRQNIIKLLKDSG